MPHLRTAFDRLLEPLDRRMIARTVAAHAGDHGVGGGERAWTCERHLKSLLFAQWAGLTSLRQIVAGLAAQSRSFYHLNLRAPCRSTLADANAERPAAVFRDIAMALIPIAAGALRRESEVLVRLLDATPIALKHKGFVWAEANARTRGLKLHLLHDPRQSRPVWFDVTSAKVDDVVAGRAIPLEPGATYVFDKGYTDYRWWAEIIAAEAVFVTRRKRNAHCRLVAEQTATGEGILSDRMMTIGHRQPRGQWRTQVAVGDDPDHGRRSEAGDAAGQVGIVGQHRADANHHRIVAAAQRVGEAAGGRAGDPLASGAGKGC